MSLAMWLDFKPLLDTLTPCCLHITSGINTWFHIYDDHMNHFCSQEKNALRWPRTQLVYEPTLKTKL